MLEQIQREILSLQQQIKIQEQERDSNYQAIHHYLSSGAHENQGVIRYYRGNVAQNIANIAALKNRIKQIQSRLQALKNALSSPPPPTKTQSTQKVLKSIESLQDFLAKESIA